MRIARAAANRQSPAAARAQSDPPLPGPAVRGPAAFARECPSAAKRRYKKFAADWGVSSRRRRMAIIGLPRTPSAKNPVVTDRLFALIPAAGSGLRMGTSVPKQYFRLGGPTLPEHAG